MTEYKDAQHILMNYRECVRHLWNTYFKDLTDGWHSFINVEHELFGALVLDQIFPADNCVQNRQNIVILPQSPIDQLDVLWNDMSNANSIIYQEIKIIPSRIDLRFINFFDWNDSGYRNYRYIQCHVRHYEIDQKLDNTEILIEVENVQISMIDAL